MRDWTGFLQGARDGRSPGQAMLVFSRVHELRTLPLRFTLLRERLGSPVKVSGLAQALQMSLTTTGRWLEILEALYIVFRVAPWHRDVARSPLKEAKVCFLDNGLVIGDASAGLENAVAARLLKHCHQPQDAEGAALTPALTRGWRRSSTRTVPGRAAPAG